MGLFGFSKKSIDSEEFLKLKREINLLQLDVELLQQRYKKKIKPPVEEEEKPTDSFNDGMDDLRKLNKEHGLG